MKATNKKHLFTITILLFLASSSIFSEGTGRVIYRNGRCFVQQGGKTTLVKNKQTAAMLCREKTKRTQILRDKTHRRMKSRKKRSSARRSGQKYNIQHKQAVSRQGGEILFKNNRCYVIRDSGPQEITNSAAKELLCVRKPARLQAAAHATPRKKSWFSPGFWKGLVPGWAQYDRGDKIRGGVLFTGTLFLAGGIAGSSALYNKQSNNFSDRASLTPLLWSFAVAPDTLLSAVRINNFNQMYSSNRNMNMYQNQYLGISGALVGWYILNLLDAYFFDKPRDGKPGYAGKNKLSLKWDWKTESNQQGQLSERYNISINLNF